MSLARRPFLKSILGLPLLGLLGASRMPATPRRTTAWDEEPGFVHGVQTRRYRVPGPVELVHLRMEILRPLLGRVNDREWFGAPAGHLLFVGFQASPMVLESRGEILGEVQIDVAVSRIGWNLVHAESGLLMAAPLDSSGELMYPPASMQGLRSWAWERIS